MVIKSSSVKSLAVFIDFENLALGFHGRSDRFEIKHVLTRLLEKGKIVAKKAYADWHRFSFYTSSLHEAAIELVEIPRRAQTGKNSADIRLCVDAMDLAYSKEHIDTFVIVSGDSDFSPLVSKLKELGKHVIGLGMTNSTSNLLRDNCDEFIYYEDLTQAAISEVAFKSEIPDTKRKAFLLLAHAYNALRRDNREIIHSSTLKETMRRMKPSFNENYHGYRTFSLLLEDAQREGLLSLATDAKSGTYVVTNMNMAIAEPASPASKSPSSPQEASGSHPRDDHHRERENHPHHQKSHRRFNNRRPYQGPQRPYPDQDKSSSPYDTQGVQGPSPISGQQESSEQQKQGENHGDIAHSFSQGEGGTGLTAKTNGQAPLLNHDSSGPERLPPTQSEVSKPSNGKSQLTHQGTVVGSHLAQEGKQNASAEGGAPLDGPVLSGASPEDDATARPTSAQQKRRTSSARGNRQWQSQNQRGQKNTRTPRSRKPVGDPSPSKDSADAPATDPTDNEKS
jgi:uncharacterized protein (TIGR00288 family)